MSNLLLPAAARRGHAHRRSAAISGDFDAASIFLPQQRLPEELDQFAFNNEDDFKSAKQEGFHFPTASALPPPPVIPALTLLPPPSPLGTHSSTLLLPILLRHRKTKSYVPMAHSAPQPSLYLTGDTAVDDNNIPSALIDLDVALTGHRRSGSAPELEMAPRFPRNNDIPEEDEDSVFDSTLLEDTPSCPPMRRAESRLLELLRRFRYALFYDRAVVSTSAVEAEAPATPTTPVVKFLPPPIRGLRSWPGEPPRVQEHTDKPEPAASSRKPESPAKTVEKEEKREDRKVKTPRRLMNWFRRRGQLA